MNDRLTCCRCKRPRQAFNVIMLDLRAPVPGTGWSCFVCDLPADGAQAALCDVCVEEWQAAGAPSAGDLLPFVFKGYPKDAELAPNVSLAPFRHDSIAHGGPWRVQRSRRHKLPPYTFCASRPGPLGNPFRPETLPERERANKRLARRRLADRFFRWLVEGDPQGLALTDDDRRRMLETIAGLGAYDYIACWCPPADDCHTQVILGVLSPSPVVAVRLMTVAPPALVAIWEWRPQVAEALRRWKALHGVA